jgi:hypothetical protein
MLRKVLKPLVSDGVEVKVGSIIDVSGWRNASGLERMRYLAPVPDEPEKPVKSQAKTSVK